MPSSIKSSLDLEAWAALVPKERADDQEYNQLIFRFKTFLDEVRNFQSLHSTCSSLRVKDDLGHPNKTENLETSPTTSPSSQSGNEFRNNLSTISDGTIDQSPVRPPKLNGQHVINLKKKFSQDQESSPSRDHQQSRSIFAQSRAQNPISRSQDTPSQHFNSVHNLVSLSSSSANSQAVLDAPRLVRAEVKQRSQSGSNSQQLLSKSIERLDNINNNHLLVGSSLEHDLGSVSNPISARSQRATLSRDCRYLQGTDSIYDAVSSDEQMLKSNFLPSAASHDHMLYNQRDVNRSSIARRNDFEAERSPPILRSPRVNLVSSRTTPPIAPVSILKSPPSDSSNCQEQSNISISSSFAHDKSNDTTSSLSLLPNNQDFGNYVNIDFFLKRSKSPSFDDIEDGSSDVSSDEEQTQMSTSLSNDRLCDDSLKDLSPRELARKLASNMEQNNSSNSLTPASSSDFLNESRNTMGYQISTTSSFKHIEANSRYGSFFPSIGIRESEISNIQSRSSTTPRESTGSRLSVTQHQKVLGMIHENQAISSKQLLSRESSQLYSDQSALSEAHTSMRSFLSDLNLSPVDDVFEDKAQRRIVKESFAVEFCGRRKLRHLFLFNDVIVCAKYQASSKQKFTFDVKWYLNLGGVSVSDVTDSIQVKLDREAIENQILAIRTNLMLLRARMQHIKRSKDKRPSKIIKKLKKKRTELEAELVLLLPHLPLVIKHVNGKKFLFFLSSNFDRSQWIESIKYLQSQLPAGKSSSSSPSSSELQAWIQTCRKNLNPSLGTFLLRSNCDDDILYGDLFVSLNAINGLPKAGHYYFCFEVDSYGHFSQKASSVVLSVDNTDLDLNEEYVLPLDGAHTLRILLYEDLGQNFKPSVIGKAHIELSRSWFFDKPVDKVVEFSSNCRAMVKLSYTNLELLSMRIQHTKLCPTFGLDITQVCKKEKTNVPMLIQLCVNEVERRGMREVGIYRMSGTSTDIQRLKKAFETNPYVAELLLRDIDINSVTGFLKTYLREMPEGLFINKLYLKFVAAFNIPQTNLLERTKKMLDLFHRIPVTNQHTIIYMVEHLVKVNKYESHNKMSLTNLATVLGPNILRPPTDTSNADSSDPFTAVVIGSMSQAGILYFFLNRRASELPLTDLDPSELDCPSSSEA